MTATFVSLQSLINLSITSSIFSLERFLIAVCSGSTRMTVQFNPFTKNLILENISSKSILPPPSLCNCMREAKPMSSASSIILFTFNSFGFNSCKFSPVCTLTTFLIVSSMLSSTMKQPIFSSVLVAKWYISSLSIVVLPIEV